MLFLTFWSSSAGTGSFFSRSISARAFAATSAGVFPSLASASTANDPAYFPGAPNGVVRRARLGRDGVGREDHRLVEAPRPAVQELGEDREGVGVLVLERDRVPADLGGGVRVGLPLEAQVVLPLRRERDDLGGRDLPARDPPEVLAGELQRLGLVEVADEDGGQVVRRVVGREVVVGLRPS